jgi:ubiquitin-conjugating enzyme E2 S
MLTKIFHPNVSRSGEICVNTLKKDWKPTYGLGHVLVTIKCLLIVPNAESALDEEAGKLLLEDWDEFCARARMWCSIHATPKVSLDFVRVWDRMLMCFCKVPPVEFQTPASTSGSAAAAAPAAPTKVATTVAENANTSEPASSPKSKLETTTTPAVQQTQIPLQPSAAGNAVSIIPENVTPSVKPPSAGKTSSASGTENGATAGVVKTTAKRVATGGVEKKKKALKRL